MEQSQRQRCEGWSERCNVVDTKGEEGAMSQGMNVCGI